MRTFIFVFEHHFPNNVEPEIIARSTLSAYESYVDIQFRTESGRHILDAKRERLNSIIIKRMQLS